jgi:hypothetical protein
MVIIILHEVSAIGFVQGAPHKVCKRLNEVANFEHPVNQEGEWNHLPQNGDWIDDP